MSEIKHNRIDATESKVSGIEDAIIKLRDENIALHSLTEKLFRDFIILVILIIVVILFLCYFYLKLLNTSNSIVEGNLNIKEDYEKINTRLDNLERGN